MWSVKLRFLHNKAHRATEWMELNTMHWGVDGTKSDRDSVQNPDASWSKCFVHKSLIKLVNEPLFLYVPTMPPWLASLFYTPLCSPSLCVTLRQSSKLKWPPLPSVFQYGLLWRRLALSFSSDYQTSNGIMANVKRTPHHLCSASARPVRGVRTRCAKHHYVNWKK